MIELVKTGTYLIENALIPEQETALKGSIKDPITKQQAKQNTIAYSILKAHNHSDSMDKLNIKFDAMASHDITYVGIVQTARASGLDCFPIPYILTNCHNSLCAVGGTINEDDHLFGLSAAKKYGGIYVPAHQAVIHQYMREMQAGCGKMILGSDSHTRYGALGTMAIGEGGPELVKQLLGKTYDLNCPDVIAVYLKGKPQQGVGPQDIALSIIGAVFESGFVKNKVMEFMGDIENLSVEYRNGIDVMTTETTCLSSIWQTDSQVADYLEMHGRKQQFKQLKPTGIAYYEGAIIVHMDKIKPMIAMPFHPSNVYSIEELNANLDDILAKVEKIGTEQLDAPEVKFTLRDKVKNGRLYAGQGVIAGCAGGTFDNICDAGDILAGRSIGNDEFALSVYPSSQPTFLSLVENGTIGKLIGSGATIRTAFCGPCFGAGDVPANNVLSIRHSTRNFPSREGSKPTSGQIASVALMDARSIAATAMNKGLLTAATDIDLNYSKPKYYFDNTVYTNRVYDGFQKPDRSHQLKFGPNIADWPSIEPLSDHILLKVVAEIHDPVTTTDELIPSGETSSYRSNPLKLAEFTLSRKDREYVGKAKGLQKLELARREGRCPTDLDPKLADIYNQIQTITPINPMTLSLGSAIYAVKPGDGSAREQAASCQRVLGGAANIAKEYATKRYRSNLMNWGMLPLLFDDLALPFQNGDYIFIPNIKEAVSKKAKSFPAYTVNETATVPFTLSLGDMTDDEREIILSGCLINFYRTR